MLTSHLLSGHRNSNTCGLSARKYGDVINCDGEGCSDLQGQVEQEAQKAEPVQFVRRVSEALQGMGDG
jgi:hypothetical protein